MEPCGQFDVEPALKRPAPAQQQWTARVSFVSSKELQHLIGGTRQSEEFNALAVLRIKTTAERDGNRCRADSTAFVSRPQMWIRRRGCISGSANTLVAARAARRSQKTG